VEQNLLLRQGNCGDVLSELMKASVRGQEPT
jgi:hypothetical protein